ncbi:MAG: S8 family serine peptidase [Limisphaerales bacterium]
MRSIFSSLFFSLLLLTESRGAEGVGSSTFTFKTPFPVVYKVQPSTIPSIKMEWMPACERDRPGVHVEFGNQVILRLDKGFVLDQVMRGIDLKLDHEFAPNLFILRASSVWDALVFAHIISKRDGVELSHPVRRLPMAKMSYFVQSPNDPLFPFQWNLENRDVNTGAIIGPEFNIREAWGLATGKGVVIGIVDDGVDLGHPEFLGQGDEGLHFNFTSIKANGEHMNKMQFHGTSVAGLAIAKWNNNKGISGVSPGARFASQVVWDINDDFGTELEVANMFRFHNNDIDIQNHSWGRNSIEQFTVPEIESVAIENAINVGRNGKGVLMIRVAGNERSSDWSANDDGYSNDPRVVTVGSVGYNGRVSGFSNAGSCVLCSGLIGEASEAPPIFTTDRMGVLGWNNKLDPEDSEAGNYFAIKRGGNSFAAPQISGLVALILEANSSLSYRDVQQVLINSSRHYDFSDPFLNSNAAGYKFSINTGFGVPDASAAVHLAKQWANKEPLIVNSYKQAAVENVPDDGLLVEISFNDEIIKFNASPGNGLVPDEETNSIPIVDVGRALNPIDIDLTDKAAFIQRGGSVFSEKVKYAADAGASFVIIYNNNGGDERFIMGDMQFVSIPAVFLSKNDGDQILEMMSNTTINPLKVKLNLNKVSTVINVPDSMICEQVGVRVEMKHPIRGDIRLTVKSPSGTRSLLQANVPDGSPWKSDWVFWTNQFFYEPSKGNWTIDISDLAKLFYGEIRHVELITRGSKITDFDNDGLSDEWEKNNFNSLSEEALGDPDSDGLSNVFEQSVNLNPIKFDRRLRIRQHSLSDNRLRFSWPAWEGFEYQVQMSENIDGPWNNLEVVFPGRYEGVWIEKIEKKKRRFFRLKIEIKP